MLQIKKLISDENVIQAIFTAGTNSDAKTMIDILFPYVSDHFHCIVDLSKIKIPVNTEVVLTLDSREGTIDLNYE